MWWLVTLLILAAVAFFVVKSMKSNTVKQQAEHELEQQARLDASAASQSVPATQVSEQSVVDSANTAAPTESDNSSSTVGGAAKDAAGVVAASAAASAAVTSGLNSGDALSDIREMIKILNLDAPDASRLQISREQMSALRKGEQTGLPDAAALDEVAARLRRMLA